MIGVERASPGNGSGVDRDGGIAMELLNTGDSPATWLIGVDVGGTKIEAVLADSVGSVVNTRRVPARPGSTAVLDDVVGVVRSLIDETGVTPAVVGVGIPGQVDSTSGMVDNVVNLDVVSLRLGPEAERMLGLPVHVENDVNAATQGAAALLDEWDRTPAEVPGGMTEAAGGADIIAFLNLGTGLAAGLLRGGAIQHGFSGALGEIGHIPVDPNRFPCPCGQVGCLETAASGGSVARLWPTADPPMPDLIAHARRGEPHARRVLGIVMHAIADTLQIVAQSYDPRLIIIGGGMAKTGRLLLDEIIGELSLREQRSNFIATLDLPARLRLAPANQPVGALGAALAAYSRVAGRLVTSTIPQSGG